MTESMDRDSPTQKQIDDFVAAGSSDGGDDQDEEYYDEEEDEDGESDDVGMDDSSILDPNMQRELPSIERCYSETMKSNPKKEQAAVTV